MSGLAIQAAQLPTYIGGGTNTTVVAGTNAIVAKVLANDTKYFNIPSVANDTNKFPPVEFVPGAGGQGSRYMAIQITGNYDATPNTTGAITYRLMSSIDRQNWVTNALVWLTTIGTAAGNPYTFQTNLDTQLIPYWCISAIGNTNATANITNLQVTAWRIPGI